MDPISADLLAYYDQDAPDRARKGVDPRRAAWRTSFVERVLADGRSAILEVGCGPGRDAPAIEAAGADVTGLDLSFEHVRLASAAGVRSVQGSLYELPFSNRSFGAGWTMSTLVHVPDARFDEAMLEIRRVLRPGALLAMGLWGGFDREGVVEFDRIEPARFFSFRSHERLREMLSRHGSIELFETERYETVIDEIYQFALLRV